uniref:Uncharacterized protein n=1 Tax=Populus trichocarpa TaxID=3694 RepID=A0A2K2AH80_POPTR
MHTGCFTALQLLKYSLRRIQGLSVLQRYKVVLHLHLLPFRNLGLVLSCTRLLQLLPPHRGITSQFGGDQLHLHLQNLRALKDSFYLIKSIDKSLSLQDTCKLRVSKTLVFMVIILNTLMLVMWVLKSRCGVMTNELKNLEILIR